MDDLAPVSELLALKPMPKIADALRQSIDQVVARWNKSVRELLPDADALTAAQVRNSIPHILSQMARALEASDAGPTDDLMMMTSNHGAVRFHESYNLKELIAEYRILRRILVEEIDEEFEGTVSTRGVDGALEYTPLISPLQQAVVSRLRSISGHS